jgi:hypothetical protein
LDEDPAVLAMPLTARAWPGWQPAFTVEGYLLSLRYKRHEDINHHRMRLLEPACRLVGGYPRSNV